MSFSWRTLAAIFVMVLLVCGCTAINQLLQEDEITGPSWDTEFALPLLPMYKVEVGKSLMEDVEEGKLLDPIRFSDAFEFQGMDMDDEFDLSAFTFSEVETVDVGGDYQGDIDDISTAFDQDPERFDIDERVGDKTSLEGFDFSEVFDSDDEGFGDIEDQKGKMDEAFDKLEPEELEMPEVDTDYAGKVTGEVDKFKMGPIVEEIPGMIEGEYSFDLDPIEFEEFKYAIFSSAELEVRLENKTMNEFQSMRVGLYNAADDSLLVESGGEDSIPAGETREEVLVPDGVKIFQEVYIRITLTIDGFVMGNVEVFTEPRGDFDIQQVQVLHPEDRYDIEESDPIENLSDDIKKVRFKSGNMRIELDLPEELNIGPEDYKLTIDLGGLPDLQVGDNDLSGLTMIFHDETDREIGEVIFKVDDADTYVVEAMVTVTFTIEDAEMEKVTMLYEEDIGPLSETIIPDDEELNVEEVTFASGYLVIDLSFLPEEWGEEITIEEFEIKIGEEVFEAGKTPLDNRTLNLEEILVDFFGKTNVYYEGAAITVDIYFEDALIQEAYLKDPITIEEPIEQDMDFPENLEQVTIDKGWLLVEIQDGGLNILIDKLEIKIDGQKLDPVPGVDDAYSMAGINLRGDGEGIKVDFKATAKKYITGTEVVVDVGLHPEEELEIGRIILAEPLEEGINKSMEELLGEDVDYIRSIKFSQGFLEVNIDDGGLEMEYTIACRIAGQDLEPMEEEDGYFLYSLAGVELIFEEEEEEDGEDGGFIFDFIITEFTYDSEAVITAAVEMRDIEWEEMQVVFDEDRLGFDTEFTIFEEGEEEVIELGLDELPEAIKQFSLNPDFSSFKLTFDNQTPVEFRVVEPLLIMAEDGDGETITDEDGNPIQVLIDFRVAAWETDEQEFMEEIVRIFDTFPHRILLSGGKMELMAPEGENGDDQAIVTFQPGMRFEMGMEFDFAMSLILRYDPDEPESSFQIRMEPNPVEMEDQEMLAWLQEATLNYTIINHMPLDGKASLYLGEFDGDPENEEDVKRFYAQDEIFRLDIVNLPEAVKNKDGFAIEESSPLEEQVKFTEEARKWFQRDDIHMGFTLEIPLDEEDKYVTFSTSDYLKLKAWAYFKIRVNPKD